MIKMLGIVSIIADLIIATTIMSRCMRREWGMKELPNIILDLLQFMLWVGLCAAVMGEM